MSVLLLISGLLLFIGLVVVHEWGHFIMARRNGVTVEEFGIFFPPRLFKHKTRGGWNFTINAIPLGGFVKLKGEHDSDTSQGSYGAATTLAKSKIMAAGVVMNFVVGLVLLMIVAVIGIPQLVPNQFTVRSDTKITKSEVILSDVEPNSPASRAGLKSVDQLEAIGLPHEKPVIIMTSEQLKTTTKRFAGQQVDITYKRQGQQHQAMTMLLSSQAVAASLKTDNPKGELGVIPRSYVLQRSTWSAPIVAVGLTGQFTALTFQGLGHALGGLGSLIAGATTGNHVARSNGQAQASSQLGGPITIFFLLKDGSLLGWSYILLIIAVISLTLGLINILPIPAIDGGRLWLTLIMRGLKKPLTVKLEDRVNGVGLVIILALMGTVITVDLLRWNLLSWL